MTQLNSKREGKHFFNKNNFTFNLFKSSVTSINFLKKIQIFTYQNENGRPIRIFENRIILFFHSNIKDDHHRHKRRYLKIRKKIRNPNHIFLSQDLRSFITSRTTNIKNNNCCFVRNFYCLSYLELLVKSSIIE